MVQYPAYEGLQAVPPDHSGLEHTSHDSLEPIMNNQGSEYAPHDVVKGSWTTMNEYPPQDGNGIEVYEKVPDYTDGNAHQKQATICGLRRRNFWYVLAVITVIILAAAIGGGVGGALASKSSNAATNAQVANSADTTTSQTSVSMSLTSTTSSATKTSTSATTTTYAQDAYPTTSLGMDCPAINETNYSTFNTAGTTSYNFKVYCNANFAAGKDLAVSNETSLDNCMQSCVNQITIGGDCLGVVWDSVMNLALTPRQNCFMKSAQTSFYWTGHSNKSASALLQS